jgi:hypothetical protein
MFSTPYLASDTICSGRPLKQFNVGDNIVLIQRVIKKGVPQFIAINGTVMGFNSHRCSNRYSYIIDKHDNTLAGLQMPFISKGAIIQDKPHDYSTTEIMIDVIQPQTSVHNNAVTLKTVGVLHPEMFISLIVSVEPNYMVTHTLLITKHGFMVVLI